MSIYQKLLRTDEGRVALAEEHAIAHVTLLIAKLMRQYGINRTKLAQKLKVSPGRVTQLLDGDANMTLSTVARILNAFGHVLDCTSRPMDQAHSKMTWCVAQVAPGWADHLEHQSVAGRITPTPSVAPVLRESPLKTSPLVAA